MCDGHEKSPPDRSGRPCFALPPRHRRSRAGAVRAFLEATLRPGRRPVNEKNHNKRKNSCQAFGTKKPATGSCRAGAVRAFLSGRLGRVWARVNRKESFNRKIFVFPEVAIELPRREDPACLEAQHALYGLDAAIGPPRRGPAGWIAAHCLDDGQALAPEEVCQRGLAWQGDGFKPREVRERLVENPSLLSRRRRCFEGREAVAETRLQQAQPDEPGIAAKPHQRPPAHSTIPLVLSGVVRRSSASSQSLAATVSSARRGLGAASLEP